MKLSGYTVAQLLDCVNTGSFEQFCELTGNTLNAEKIRMVGPFKNKLF